jgi:vesicle coat complex subunit
MELQEAKQIRATQSILIDRRKQLFEVIGNPHNMKALKNLGFINAVKAYSENHIGQEYFNAIATIKEEVNSINLQLNMLPKIPLEVHLQMKKMGVI